MTFEIEQDGDGISIETEEYRASITIRTSRPLNDESHRAIESIVADEIEACMDPGGGADVDEIESMLDSIERHCDFIWVIDRKYMRLT